LGPLELVGDDGQPIMLPAGKPRALLALVGLEAGHVVSLDRIVDVLWSGRPPATAAKVVQGYVSRLRKLLPTEVLLTREPGYLLRLERDQLDLTRFEVLRREAAAASAAGRYQAAAQLLREALALWRGRRRRAIGRGGAHHGHRGRPANPSHRSAPRTYGTIIGVPALRDAANVAHQSHKYDPAHI
jgi:DNA-binding SARP family transcriptional activator